MHEPPVCGHCCSVGLISVLESWSARFQARMRLAANEEMRAWKPALQAGDGGACWIGRGLILVLMSWTASLQARKRAHTHQPIQVGPRASRPHFISNKQVRAGGPRSQGLRVAGAHLHVFAGCVGQ